MSVPPVCGSQCMVFAQYKRLEYSKGVMNFMKYSHKCELLILKYLPIRFTIFAMFIMLGNICIILRIN